MQKPWIGGLLGLLLMACSVGGYWYFMKHTEVEMQSMETIKPVRLLQSGEVIEASMLRTVRIAQAAHHPQAVTNPQFVLGQTVTVPIDSDEELLPWKLTDTRMTPLSDERYFSFKTDATVNVNNMVRRGDRVDVWVEFESPRAIADPSGVITGVGAVKIIEQLPVAAVKTAEGQEVVDGGTLDPIIPSAKAALQETRSKPNGKPELNTYIMSDEVYEAYVIGGTGGRIKLALPDLTTRMTGGGKVTELYTRLKEADAFSPEPQAAAVRPKVALSEAPKQEPSAQPAQRAQPSQARTQEVKP
ncbi:SAF domain-containing protein [Paenibacillus sp.]|uniref:SAF domain-containing protein n=1 Tax=Paenibacillus TaxID=44249 RepID=UPI0035696449